MSRRRNNPVELGHDAFLDIVANLVGILIILVVVMGMQTQGAINLDNDPKIVNDADDPSRPTLASSNQLAELEKIARQAIAAQSDSDRLEASAQAYDEQLKRMEADRAMALDLVNMAQEAWQESQSELDQDKVRLAKLQSEFDAAGREISDLAGMKDTLKSNDRPVVAVEHLPTPMAKTVFGDEVHLRLKENRLSVVPVMPLLDAIKQEFQRSLSGSTDGRSTSAVGPIRGYVAHYAMDRGKTRITRDGRSGMATMVSLAGMAIEPLEEPYGQPIQDVLSGGNLLDVELAGRDPGTTTVTVWVYPESFASFRALKEKLYARGFATAARPLPVGKAITGGPNGSQSSAQ